MQRDLGRIDATRMHTRQDFGREMQTGRGRGDRSPLLRINRLVALAVLRTVLSPDIWRQRHMPDALDGGKEIGQWIEAQNALAKFSAGNDFGSQFVAKCQPLTDTDLAA